MRRPPQDLSDPADDARPSKTQVKRAMLELTELGAALIELPEDRLEAVEMDERLREALQELRRLTAHGARKRQLQYVGKLLRLEDPEPFRRALADHRAGRQRDAEALHAVEQWRERLLDDEAAVGEWLARHPRLDTPSFHALVRDARRERIDARAAAAHPGTPKPKGRAYRALFQQIRSALADPAQ